MDDEKDYLEYYDEMSVHYMYSVGELTPFFKAVREEKKLLGAKCTNCGFVYFPPRASCSKCYVPNEWVELPGTGRIEAATVCHFGRSQFTDKMPIVIAFIRLDGADSAIRHTIVTDDPRLERLKRGTRVKVAFRDAREGKVTDFYFVLDDESGANGREETGEPPKGGA
ncbi:MAG: Zn-ribbon domain-containing OB-fold protein [Promethearchaeota archaeon]